eukprot:2669249-Heterocapsa_arctica.AAC.1
MEDHKMVRARLCIGDAAPRPVGGKGTDKVNKCDLVVPRRLEMFQHLMWRYVSPVHLSIDDHAAAIS